MNEFQGGGDIDNVVRVFPSAGTKNQQGHPWPRSLSARVNQVMPNLAQQRFPRIQECGQALFNLR